MLTYIKNSFSYISNIMSYKSNRKTAVKIKRNYDFEKLEKANSHRFDTSASLDNITWNDLNMNSVFQHISDTSSSPGEDLLYAWLRNPIDNENTYEIRKKMIRRFEKNSSEIEVLRNKLGSLAYCKYDFKGIMKSDFNSNLKLLVFHLLLSLINIFVILNIVTNGVSIIATYLIVLFPINMFLHFKFKEKYGSQLEVLQYSIKLVKFTRESIDIIKLIDLDLYDELEFLFDKLKLISKNEVILFRMEGLDLIADYINITLLIKEINYFLIAGRIQKLKRFIIELYDLVGKIDCVISVIRYRKTLIKYCEPIIKDEFKDIYIKDAYHPLIENAISNSIRISKDIAITGSNMSGKSTFLRTVGVNAVLAQSICTSLSTSYEAKYYRIHTSISLNDAIQESKSYFLMEAEAIKRMLNVSENSLPTLLLIDEIFKGTNPVERYAASIEVLNALGYGNSKVIVTTHDLNIIPQLVNYENYYFTENITSHSLEFDFKIQQGIANSRNAVKILEYVDYPNDLIGRIYSRIENAENEDLVSVKTS